MGGTHWLLLGISRRTFGCRTSRSDQLLLFFWGLFRPHLAELASRDEALGEPLEGVDQGDDL